MSNVSKRSSRASERSSTKIFGSESFMTYEVFMSKCPPQKSDILEINRGKYFHYALYDCDSMCFHITLDDGDYEIFDPVIGMKAYIRYHHLKNILANNKKETPSKVRVNNQEDRAKEEGLNPRNPDEIITQLKNLVNTEVNYQITSCNCETYATQWRYGRGWTEQGKPF